MSLGSSYGAAMPSSPSLLNPPNPSFSPVDNIPRGGILLNRRESDSPATRPVLLPIVTPPSLPTGKTLDPESPQTPISPVNESGISLSSPKHVNAKQPSSPLLLSSPAMDPTTSTGSASGSGSAVPHRIRFAPLPDPRRPRSLSTGRNVVWKPSEGPGGESIRKMEIRGVDDAVGYEEDPDGQDAYDNEAEVDDAVSDEEGDDRDLDDDEKRGRRWSKTVGSWGKGTKKLFGVKDREEPYADGAALKKSVSTGGFIGSSPFRWNQETERRRSMQGPSPASPFRPDHRRGASLETASGSLSSSPQPVKMLNGRVYGSRRANELADRQRKWRENMEPAFVEWGNGKTGGLGSNSPTVSKKDDGFLGDEDDGSGMEWVRKRREERRRREAERRELEGEPGRARSDSGLSAGESDDGRSVGFQEVQNGGTKDPPRVQIRTNPLAVEGNPENGAANKATSTPQIHVSQYLSPNRSNSLEPGTDPAARPIPISHSAAEDKDDIARSAPIKMQDGSLEHHTEAIQVPMGGHHGGHGRRGMSGRGVDVFGDGSEQDTKNANQDSFEESAVSRRGQDDDDEDEDEEEDDDENDDDDDDEYDDDDEEDDEAIRTTSSAAGVEKVSRHKDKPQ